MEGGTSMSMEYRLKANAFTVAQASVLPPGYTTSSLLVVVVDTVLAATSRGIQPNLMRSETLSEPHTSDFPIPPIVERPLAIDEGPRTAVSAFGWVSDVTPIYRCVQENALSIVG
jgi:hypothetical protein